MAWRVVNVMSLRLEFVTLAAQPGAKLSELCRRFGVSRQTGYKWLARFGEAGEAGLVDRSRRPHGSPSRTDAAVEEAVLAVRRANRCWGGRKIRRVLLNARPEGLPAEQVPAASTITGILRRHGLLERDEPAPQPFKRFEAVAPNRLWQMDFKGHFALDGRTDGGGVRCLTPILSSSDAKASSDAELNHTPHRATCRLASPGGWHRSRLSTSEPVLTRWRAGAEVGEGLPTRAAMALIELPGRRHAWRRPDCSEATLRRHEEPQAAELREHGSERPLAVGRVVDAAARAWHGDRVRDARLSRPPAPLLVGRARSRCSRLQHRRCRCRPGTDPPRRGRNGL
ncbi:MAG: helix-turn-helix domain-containing protein [Geminicoccaceae bacterium]